MSITKVYIVYYSLYGHVNTMAREVHKGAASIEGVEATLWRVPEILSDRILEKMKAPPKPDDVADIKPEQLVEADALIFGFPSRFGMMPSQLKAFFDATGELWASQALAGKPAGIFWSTGFNGGGQELSAWTAITQLAHHGMLYVPLGYTFGSGMFEMDEVKGGSAYGAGTFAGDGTRQPTELELQQAFYQGFMLSLQNRRVDDVFNDSDPELLIPGFTNLVPSSVLPNAAYSKDGGYEAYYNLARRINDTKGIIVNTFSDLEQYSIDALYDHDEKIPPIYAVGPLLDLKGQPNPKLDQSQLDLILRWLDKQPNKSVVFLCFGSMGVSFGPSQIREIALGLKHSGVRFLWAMKSPPRTNNYEEKRLPEGFLEWMELEGKGMICGWAPQVEVLAHKAIGGFVSHCGWNSILESMWFGVPILTWPIYAEQQLNAFRMVKELGLAVELRVDYRIGSKEIVMAEEIEKGLKNLMEKENILLKKVQEMARNAVLCGGSSFISVGKLINIMIGSN